MTIPVDDLLAAYALSAPVRWEALDHHRHVFRVSTGSAEAPHFLKCYPADLYSPEDVRHEAEVVNRLSSVGVGVALPVANGDGDWVTGASPSPDGGCAALFQCAPGRIIAGDRLSATQSEAFGQLAARMHGAMDASVPAFPRRRMDVAELLDRPMARLGPLMAPAQRRSLTRATDWLREVLAGLGPARQPFHGLCHGDLHAGNVTFDERDQPTLFDFESMEYGWRAYDLAQVLWRLGHSWDDSQKDHRLGRWQAFVDGYESVRPLAKGEKEAVPACVPLRLIWYMAFRLRCSDTSLDGDYFASRIAFLEAWMRCFNLG